MIGFTSKGSFKHLESFLATMTKKDIFAALDSYGQEGVTALSSATPVKTGLTATSWYYEVEHKRGKYSIVWKNSHVVDGQIIAILLEYGHGTGTGGFVQGNDYINPAIKPVMDKIANDVWKAVTNA